LFQGSHAYHLDDKSRLKMPSEFAAALGATFTLTRGRTNCIWVWKDEDWRVWAEQLQSLTLGDPGQLAMQRFFVGSAASAAVDGQGRLMIPPVLREFAGLEHEAMVVGTGARVEIWSRERWDAYEKQITDELIEENARRLSF
jgi:MraZ protein